PTRRSSDLPTLYPDKPLPPRSPAGSLAAAPALTPAPPQHPRAAVAAGCADAPDPPVRRRRLLSALPALPPPSPARAPGRCLPTARLRLLSHAGNALTGSRAHSTLRS